VVGWFRKYAENVMQNAEPWLQDVCEGKYLGFMVLAQSPELVPMYLSWLKKKLGEKLLDFQISEVDGWFDVDVKIDEALKKAYLGDQGVGQDVPGEASTEEYNFDLDDMDDPEPKPGEDSAAGYDFDLDYDMDPEEDPQCC
jgi:hypothetical protein